MKNCKNNNKPYKPFFPLKLLKGTINKVHRLGMNSYLRFIYVNPIEGLLYSFQNLTKFPNSPSYKIKLNDIRECSLLVDEKL